MILIISEKQDITTDKTIDWLHYYGYTNIVRINDGDSIEVNYIKISNNINENNIILIHNNQKISLNNIVFFWYRRGKFSFDVSFEKTKEMVGFEDKMEMFINYEWLYVKKYIIKKLEKKPNLGDFTRVHTNKLINLETAVKCGLLIPSTLLSQDHNILSSTVIKKECITKPIRETIYFEGKSYHTDTFTSIVREDMLVDMEDFVVPQLLQDHIKKWIELRIVIIDNNFFTMAMFTQYDKKNQIDFRYYSKDETVRYVPFNLPNDIKIKLLKFMKHSNLSTGSVDMIVTHDLDYIFLEINPIGIIDMVEFACNFNIEKHIAKYIIKKGYGN